MTTLLQVDNLTVTLRTPSGVWPVVRDASFAVPAGETLALVGESGCGKSMTALALMQLLPPVARIATGSIHLVSRKGPVDLCQQSPQQLRALRGSEVAMIFQEPLSALNPVMTIGDQIAEAIFIHLPTPPSSLTGRVIELLQLVGLPDPALRMAQYPHELSGGMRQRVMIAMALAHRPQLLIADEPTTALDVTIQAQILELLRSLQQQLGMAMLLITHDLGVVAQSAQHIAVMYAGQIVEQGAAATVLKHPRHPYTAGLLAAFPQLTRTTGRMPTIPGTVPELSHMPTGCAFAARCPRRRDRCADEVPWTAAGLRGFRCHFPLEAPDGTP